MMLKINKTLPKNKAGSHSSIYYVGLATLICGIMPGLMRLSGYIMPTQKVSAADKTIEDIEYMQQLSKEVCEATAVGKSTQLIDLRDNNEYTVAKLSDGKCWMTQNLRIVNKVITPKDSDVSESFTIPASSEDGFSRDAAVNVYYAGSVDYGTYYSWCAATAGCSDVNGDNPGNNVNAASSICPKGWRMPSGNSTGDYQILTSKGKSYWTTNGGKNGYWIGATNSNGGAFFPAAGRYDGGGIIDAPGVYGRYWSSTARSETEAYDLEFDSGSVSPTNTNPRRSGRSVRCIGADILEADLPPVVPDLVDEKDINVIAIVVPPVISIDAAEGDSIEVDPNVISSGTITATVSANTTYKVQLSASQTSLLNPNDPTSTGIPASSNLAIRTNGWGILNDPNDSTRLSDYAAITTSPTTYYNTTTTNEDLSTTHTFGIGVAVALTLPAATYSTSVTITAVNN